MENARDIYGDDGKAKRLLERIIASSEIHSNNKKLLSGFIDNCKARGLKPTSLRKDLHALKFILEELGDKNIDNAKRQDFERILAKLSSKDWTEWTKRNHRLAVRKFVKWVKGYIKPHVYPEEVDWIPVGKGEDNKLLHNDLITKEEFDRMMTMCNNPRDKAMLSILFETGMRIGELLSIKIGDISANGNGKTLARITGKTGVHVVPIVVSKPALQDWLDQHPLKDKRDAYLFVTRFSAYRENPNELYVPIEYNGIRKTLKTLVKRAGLNKRVYFHLFRHSSASDKSNWMSDRQLMKLHGWKTPKMLERYSHMNVDDLIQVMEKHYKTKDTERKRKLTGEATVRLLQVMYDVIRNNPNMQNKVSKASKEIIKDLKMEDLVK
ncbi:MAG: tyrosine-type recombinase/integrase [Candidatus Aenigmarchaeota archaeon]|nr:tyrosine-type recombinase/integrase [Candidatus Aenigmarchaeota archaeon]